MSRGKERRSRRTKPPTPSERREAERRSTRRIPVEMWVEQTVGRELYFQRAANLSEGGLFLERTVPHPTGTVVNLKFLLHGEEQPILVKGQIVNTGGDDEDLGMGVHFIDLPVEIQTRIRAFIDRESSQQAS